MCLTNFKKPRKYSRGWKVVDVRKKSTGWRMEKDSMRRGHRWLFFSPMFRSPHALPSRTMVSFRLYMEKYWITSRQYEIMIDKFRADYWEERKRAGVVPASCLPRKLELSDGSIVHEVPIDYYDTPGHYARKYKPGFHVFTNKKDAMMWLRYVQSDSYARGRLWRRFAVVPVKLGGYQTLGYQTIPRFIRGKVASGSRDANVVVSEYMYIDALPNDYVEKT